MLYDQGEDGRPLEHSLGMQKGLLGVVHAFADRQQIDYTLSHIPIETLRQGTLNAESGQ